MSQSLQPRLSRAVAGVTRRDALCTMLSGSAFSAAGVIGLPVAGSAKHHKHKCKEKTCKGGRLGKLCEKAKECCSNETNLLCSVPNGASVTACCAGINGACLGNGDCCLGFVCEPPGVCVVGSPDRAAIINRSGLR